MQWELPEMKSQTKTRDISSLVCANYYIMLTPGESPFYEHNQNEYKLKKIILTHVINNLITHVIHTCNWQCVLLLSTLKNFRYMQIQEFFYIHVTKLFHGSYNQRIYQIEENI